MANKNIQMHQYVNGVWDNLYPITLSENVNGLENTFAEVDSKIGTKLSITKLWENASPTSSFPSTVVPLDLSQYEFVGIQFMTDPGADWSTTEDRELHIYRVNGGAGQGCASTVYYINNILKVSMRYFYIHSSDITFSNGIGWGDVTTAGGSSTFKQIPVAIYGIGGTIG